jgi:uncharacterized membrane protein (UPF0127 family)
MRHLLNKIKTLIFLSILLFIPACNVSNDGRNNTRIIEVRHHTIQVEIADTPIKRANGLSFRDTLAEDHGMLFIFPDESRRGFHMLGCKFDIDLAYIESNGIISEIITMEKEPLSTPPESLTTYLSQSTTIRYALEMIGGWFEEHDISVGTIINLN